MADKGKVIKGLECCMKWTGEPNTATCHCSDCSYTNMDVFGERCLIDLINDALALLKEQEEKRTPKPIIHGHKEEYWGEEEICPDCGKKWQSEIIDTTHFCPNCGRSVK